MESLFYALSGQVPRVNSRYSQFLNNMRNIAFACQNYAVQNDGKLPTHSAPPDGSDVPLSWRVKILPYLDQEGLRTKWDDRQVWDSVANAPLAATEMELFGRWDSSTDTRVVAVTGPGTLWPDGAAHSLEDIPDGAGHTILLIEYPFDDISWVEPRDLSLEEALELYSQSTLPDVDFNATHTFRKGLRTWVAVILADGSARRLQLGLPKETLRGLFTVNGGEEFPEDAFH